MTTEPMASLPTGQQMTSFIGSALSFVYQKVGYVQKSGQMSHGERYTYAGEADFIRAVRPAMAEAGLIGPYPFDVKINTTEHAPTKRGARQFRTEVLVTYRLMHGSSGDWIEIMSPGTGIDVGDKATYKAMTGAYKYCLRQLFCIETGDDPDDTGSREQEAEWADNRAPPAVELEVAPHDPEWDDDRARFCARLRELGFDYNKVRDWAVSNKMGKPSTWGRQGRVRFMRDLIDGRLPSLSSNTSGPGAAG